MKLKYSLYVLALTLILQGSTLIAGTPKWATPLLSESKLTFKPHIEVDYYHLRISTPEGRRIELHFEGFEEPYFQVQDAKLKTDGFYTFELMAHPRLSEKAEHAAIQTQSMVMTGTFQIQQGRMSIPSQDLKAEQAKDKTEDSKGFAVDDSDEGNRAQTYQEDLIVFWNQCLGNKCVDGESFGLDSFLFKENILRLKFEDTSDSTGMFPSNDWQIRINESQKHGQSYFAIVDETAEETSFKVIAGVTNNGLVVDAQGDVALGMENGPLALNIQDPFNAGFELHQSGTSGWQPHTWSILGNETYLSILDATNGKAPFRITTSAKEDSIVLKYQHHVGIGTDYPSATLHLYRPTSAHHVIEAYGTLPAGDHTLFTLKNYGGSRLEMVNTNQTNKTWQIANANNRDFMQFTLIGSGGLELKLTEAGDLVLRKNLIAGGSIIQTSDRNAKENFKAIQEHDILNKVAALEIQEWNYIGDEDETRHMGPMAQDFHAAFGVGRDNKHIALVDMDGVVLASIKALNQKVDAHEPRIQDLEATVNQNLMALTALTEQEDAENDHLSKIQSQSDALAARISRIEAMLQSNKN